MTRPTFSSMRMPAKCGGDRAGGGRSVEDGSPHAPAMTCHPVPYGERRVRVHYNVVFGVVLLSLRRLGPLRIEHFRIISVPNRITLAYRTQPCRVSALVHANWSMVSSLALVSALLVSSDQCAVRSRRGRLLSGPRAEWTGVYARRLPAGGLASGPKHTTTTPPCTPPRTPHGTARRSRDEP
jgi:hypothetical protein